MPVPYSNFYIPQSISLLPCFPPIFHHFSPLLSIHLLHCGKCGKSCGKLAYLAYKYPINHRKIPAMPQKSCQNTLLVFFISCSLDILYGFYYEFLSVSDLLYPLYIGNPWFPYPPLPEKTFSLFSSSPHFVRVAVKPFFIYRTCGSQMKKPTSSYSHFGKEDFEIVYGRLDWLILDSGNC